MPRSYRCLGLGLDKVFVVDPVHGNGNDYFSIPFHATLLSSK